MVVTVKISCTLKMEAVGSSRTFIRSLTTRRYISGVATVHLLFFKECYVINFVVRAWKALGNH
jgi:hypothetical protein